MSVFSCLLQGFLSLFALIRIMQLSTANPLTIVLFAVICFIYYQFTLNHVACRIGSSDIWRSSILSVLFTVLMTFAKYPVIVLNSGSLIEKIVITVFTGVGLLLIFYYSLLWLFVVTGELTINRNLYPVATIPVFTFILSFAFGIFYLLVEYPGIIPEKTNEQLSQVYGLTPLTDDTSLVYTVLLDKLYKLFSLVLKDSDKCITALIVLQILFLSFIAGYVVKTLQKAHIHAGLCVLTMLFYLIPFNQRMAVTLSSDVLLAANLCGYIAVLIRFFLKPDQRYYTNKRWASLIIPYFIFSFMICCLSRNGFVTFLITLPLVILTLKEKWKIIISVNAIVLAIYAFIKFPFMHIYGISKPSWVSLLSPTVVEIFSKEKSFSLGFLLRKLLYENAALWYPQSNTLTISSVVNESGLIHLPSIVTDTILTMQTCIPLYGIIWSTGLLFWIVLISMFICGKNDRNGNIAFILPIFIYILSLWVLAPIRLTFENVYPMFIAAPIIVFLPFIDAESDNS